METLQEQKVRWKDADRERVTATGDWPAPYLHVKTQPWVEGEQRFGILVEFEQTYQVMVKDRAVLTDQVETFESVEDLIETWGVD